MLGKPAEGFLNLKAGTFPATLLGFVADTPALPWFAVAGRGS